MDPLAVLAAFVAIFPAELPDKTMFASMVLTARTGHPRAVWVGATAAFAVHAAIAVALGRVLHLLPETVVALVTAAMFFGGAALLLREGSEVDEDAEPAAGGLSPRDHGRIVARAAFVVVFVAEWGDLTQVTTAGLAARTGSPLSVWLGALLALSSVAAIAVTAGQAVMRVLPVGVVRRVAAAVFVTLGVLSLVGLAT